MKLTMDGISKSEPWEKAGICLPGYSVEAAAQQATFCKCGKTPVSCDRR